MLDSSFWHDETLFFLIVRSFEMMHAQVICATNARAKQSLFVLVVSLLSRMYAQFTRFFDTRNRHISVPVGRLLVFNDVWAGWRQQGTARAWPSYVLNTSRTCDSVRTSIQLG